MDKVCIVCTEKEAKYKCPKCSLAYCSVVCYKVHKETPCESNTPVKDTPPIQRKEITFLEEEEDQRIEPERLQGIAYSDEIQSYLESPDIQAIITKVDTSQDPETALDEARKTADPRFHEFLDTLLRVVNKNTPL
ncbi:hypothetical protein BDF14DRAFT_584821 [Spinellus fusiger]|nr:hypothetical protein BDF14DRAFT_584821 [Spinellus fusiger]